MEILQKITPHLVILDISMPRLNGLVAAAKITQLYPDIKVLILSMHRSKEYLHRALAVGVVAGLAAVAVHNLFDNLYVHGLNAQVGLLLGIVGAIWSGSVGRSSEAGRRPGDTPALAGGGSGDQGGQRDQNTARH